jgi:hypothetical protein
MTTDKFLSDVTIWIMGLYLHSSEENDEELNLISSQRVGSLQLFDETSAWLGFKQSIARITDDNEHNFISITVTRGAAEGGVYIGPSLGQWEGMEIIASKKYSRYAPHPLLQIAQPQIRVDTGVCSLLTLPETVVPAARSLSIKSR